VCVCAHSANLSYTTTSLSTFTPKPTKGATFGLSASLPSLVVV
jgi:hypothetical protein